MDQEAAFQAIIDQYSSPRGKSIIIDYLKTKKGRVKLAHSMIHPARLLVEYISKGSKVTVNTLEYTTRIELYRSFLAAVPEEEKQGEPYTGLQKYVVDIEAFLERPKSPESSGI